jgi:hypothetical protein
MKRAEAIALLKELGSGQLVEPSLVLIERKRPDFYQLIIKGNYNFQEIKTFLGNKFLVEESKNCLVISSF